MSRAAVPPQAGIRRSSATGFTVAIEAVRFGVRVQSRAVDQRVRSVTVVFRQPAA
jgi:hypothetical protein